MMFERSLITRIAEMKKPTIMIFSLHNPYSVYFRMAVRIYIYIHMYMCIMHARKYFYM